MTLERFTNIEPPTESKQRNRYNFDQFKPGDSTHVATDRERRNVLIAFKYWAHHIRKAKGAYATSRKVGADDPAGEGYRIWFMSRKAEATAAKDEI